MKVASLVVAASLAAAATGLAQPRVNATAQAMVDFQGRVAAYVDLVKNLSAKLPALKTTGDPAEIGAREIALGDAIRAGRATAKAGDILTRETAQAFRRIVKNDFRRRSQQRQKLVLAEIPHFRPQVNQTYPSEAALATFPSTLLTALPALPEGIEYRLLSEALILHDVKANIIIDFILDVF